MAITRDTVRSFASGALLVGLATQGVEASHVERLRALAEKAAAEAAANRVAGPDRLEILSVRFGGADPVTSPVTHLELIDGEGPNASGAMRFRFRMKSGDDVLGVARVSVRGVVRGPVLVAKRTLTHGRPVPPDAVEISDEDLTRLGGEPVREFGALAGRVPVRTLGSGRVLGTHLLQPEPLVRRGQAVNLTIRRGGLTVTARGAVQRDGIAGDTVPAENLATGARLLGRVLADGSLLVVQGASPARRR